MPVVRVRASKRPSKSDSLVRKVTEATCDLLAQSDRVLVVYGKETASLYYDEGAELPPSLPRAS
jgi:phenylpyruvate tautomerase PptA (4-oxalocrotonate tautomerase family)